jgi:hypothetical protein
MNVSGIDPKFDENGEIRDAILLYYYNNPNSTFSKMNYSDEMRMYPTPDCKTAIALLLEDGFLACEKLTSLNEIGHEIIIEKKYRVSDNMQLNMMAKINYGI